MLTHAQKTVPRSTFGHRWSCQPPHLHSAGQVSARRSECNLVEIVEISFLVVGEGAVGASKKVEFVFEVAKGGVHARIQLKLVGAFAAGPVAGVEIVEVEGVVDVKL